MARTAFLLIAASMSALLCGPTNAQLAMSATGDDGHVSVTVSVDRDSVTPGEVARIIAGLEVLGHGPLQFPQGNHQPLAFLYLQTPAGDVFVYPESGISPKGCRALELTDYRRPLVLTKGLGVTVIRYDIPMVNPSPEWLDARTLEPVHANFRTEGVYEAWVKYTIPNIEGLPANAWNGTIETDRFRFTVREIPVADRRANATAEQIAHLEAYINYLEDRLSGKDVEPIRPEVIEMPHWMSLDNRLRWAFERTENEGFARHAVALLRKHQQKEGNEPYPKWWSSVEYFVRGRAYLNRGYGQKPLKIFGPYLDEYVPVAALEIERELAGLSYGASEPSANLNLILDYLDHEPQSPIRQRLETLARRYSRIPVGSQPGDRMIRHRLATSWMILFALEILRDGMPFKAAKAILGEPSGQKDEVVWWNYTTGSRLIEPGVRGKIAADGRHENIVFTHRDEW